MQTILTVFFVLLANLMIGQTFITIDKDTNEFIENVNYSLFKDKKTVSKGVTLPNQPTIILDEVKYDSIAFSRVDYESLGLAKNKLDSVIYLSKKIVNLDEVVVTSKSKKDIVFGENNRFIRSMSNPIQPDLDNGLVFRTSENYDLILKKIVFYVEKVVYKTAYKINFFNIEEVLASGGTQVADIGDLIFSTDTLYLNTGQNNKIEINSAELKYKLPKKIFVTIQLLNYFDTNGEIIKPKKNNLTKLKFQMSTTNDFYARTIDFYTKELSQDLFNINFMIKYDFSNSLHKKPHKSILVTPAIVLYAGKFEE
ncbi:hypothetical protein HYN48_14070 [Flavobacterium magnum]|uniref:Uncharacterized protein n=1 Tax=Flavobacterium magnum TaxID=2162713 RepID=A0A2S0RHI9_9FLAO|nr:hypothetical protein [Flavobacterium magnum]AWA31126.1 hypothetical protein HYN48_14070 [Flavobacterium magnum]